MLESYEKRSQAPSRSPYSVSMGWSTSTTYESSLEPWPGVAWLAGETKGDGAARSLARSHSTDGSAGPASPASPAQSRTVGGSAKVGGMRLDRSTTQEGCGRYMGTSARPHHLSQVQSSQVHVPLISLECSVCIRTE